MTLSKYSETMSHNNEHASKYYQQMKNNFDVLKFIQRVYDKNSENLLNLIKKF